MDGQRYTEYASTSRFEGLDAIRGIAILAVIGHHVAGGVHDTVLERGLGVTVFFVLSGFIITVLLLREQRASDTIALGHFYGRRWLRTLPLYYAVLGLYVVLVAVAERDTVAGARFFSDIPAYLTFTSNWFVLPEGRHRIFYFAWSLATQEQFYLLWPLVVRHARRRGVAAAVMAGCVVVGEATRWAIASGQVAPLGLGARVLGSIPTPICLGAIAALALDRPRTFGWAWSVAGQPWTVPAWLALLALPSLLDIGIWQVGYSSVCIVILLLACVLRPEGLARPLLVSSWARFLGRISYGVYLFHMLALNVVRRLLPAHGLVLDFVGTTLLSAGIATASYTWFERPIADAGRRWLRQVRPPARATANTE